MVGPRLALATLAAIAGVAGVARSVSRATLTAAPAAVHDDGEPDDGEPDVGNVTTADYVGPDTCGECHERNHRRWQRTLHAAMNQLAAPGAVIGDFAGAHVAYAGGDARFERDGDRFVMILTAPGGAPHRWRITRTIGSAYLQEYVGVPDDAGGDPTEVRLPWGWWRRAGWVPQPYYDSWFGAEYAASGAPAFDAFTPEPTPWASRCAWCHNTYPFELRMLRGAVGVGPEQYVDAVAPTAPPIADNRLPIDRLVTVGISCESCHLGGRAHAGDPDRGPPSFVPVGAHVRRHADAPDLAGGRRNPRVIDLVCAQCHSTPAPRFADGAPARNSSEALALAAGDCASAIRCTDCHDPHERGPGSGAPDQRRHLAACVKCHRAYAEPAAARAHSGHDGVSCLDCHMPRIVQGVSSFVRSHRISSPGDPRMLASGGPDACALCHLDRSRRWIVESLARGWGMRVALPAAGDVDVDAPVGPAWLAGPVATARITAAAAYARRHDRRALPMMAAALDDPIAYPRMWMRFAIEELIGRPLTASEYDPLAPPSVRAAQAAALADQLTSDRP